MRVGVDAHVLDGRAQGSQTVLMNLIPELARQAPLVEFVIYSRLDLPEEFNRFPNIRHRRLILQGSILRLMVEFPFRFRIDRLNNLIFNYINSPLISNSTIIMHDVLPLARPELFSKSFATRCKVFFSAAILTSKYIFTVSKYSLKEMKTLFPDRAGKMYLAYNGPSFQADDYFVSPLHSVSGSRNLAIKYILCVGRIEKRKNVEMLVEAFKIAGLGDVKLLIAGTAESGYDMAFSRAENVDYLGRVESSDLITLYRGASLFVFPSAAEGFGIPLLDAILFGVPVVSSDRTCMPEIGMDVPFYFNPDAPDAAVTLARILTEHFGDINRVSPASGETREALYEKYSWAAAASAFIAAICQDHLPLAEVQGD